MVSALIVNRNSYVTLEEATTYLDDSIRAHETWCDLSTDEQKRALITAARMLEAVRFQGTQTGTEIAATAVVAAGGTGYAVDDELTVSGGTGLSTIIRVLTVSAGVVTGIEIVDAGSYTTSPTSPVATTGGTGTGATLTLTLEDQIFHFPATGVTDRNGSGVDSGIIPPRLKDGQIQLAYEMTANTDIETSGGVGSNAKRYKAGEVEIEYFVPTGGVGGSGSARFPAIVLDLVGEFLAVSGPTEGAYATGTDVESYFDDDQYTLSGGF